LSVTREEIRRKRFSILVEGYLDLIILFQSGVRNIVASLGTALTTEQAKLIRRFAPRVVVNYDGDRAGIKAAMRAIETLLTEEFEIKVLILPDSNDPDEFIKAQGVEEYETRRGKVILSPKEFAKKFGIEEYERHRGAAIPFIQFILDQATQEHNLKVAANKADAVNEVLPVLRAVRNKVQRREYFDYAMDRLSVEPALHKDLWQTVSTAPNAEGQLDVKRKIIAAETDPPTVAEQKLLELLVHDEELRRAILSQVVESDYDRLATAAVFRALKELDARGERVDFSTLGALIEGDAFAADIMPLVLMHESERAEGEAIDAFLAKAESCLITLRLMSYERRIKELAAEIAAAGRAGDEERHGSLLMKKFELEKQLSALRPRGGPASPSTT
jgi:DNA primase